jgi:cytochrome P450
MKNFNVWRAEIAKSPEKNTTLNIAVVFERIFSRNIVTIAFGEDISDEKFEIMKCKERNSLEFYKKECSIREALSEVIIQNLEIWMRKATHPINIAWKYTGKVYNISEADGIVDANNKTIRSFVMAYVQDRKSGKRKSAIEGKVDLLTMFFENPEIFTDDLIVDELLDFFIAAAITTQYATQTAVSHFIKSPDSLARIRDEFNSVKDEALKDDSSLKIADREAFLRKFVTLERVQDLEYLNCVMQEVLRWESPAQNTSQFEVTEQFTMRGVTYPKGTQFNFTMNGLHMNSKEWQRPREFLPDRFNPESPLYPTPSGKKRHPFSWMPFAAGTRVCFGKTFAEANMKFMFTYLTQFFDFEWAEEEKVKFAGDEWPGAYAFKPNEDPVKVVISERP